MHCSRSGDVQCNELWQAGRGRVVQPVSSKHFCCLRNGLGPGTGGTGFEEEIPHGSFAFFFQ
jgi:hypothetical protein